MRSFVQTHQFRDHARSLSAQPAWRDIRRKRRGVLCVFEERSEKMDVEELKEHAVVTRQIEFTSNRIDEELTA